MDFFISILRLIYIYNLFICFIIHIFLYFVFIKRCDFLSYFFEFPVFILYRYPRGLLLLIFLKLYRKRKNDGVNRHF